MLCADAGNNSLESERRLIIAVTSATAFVAFEKTDESKKFLNAINQLKQEHTMHAFEMWCWRKIMRVVFVKVQVRDNT